MNTVLATSRRFAIWALVLAGGLSPLVQAQTFEKETAIQQMPSDVAVTPDGSVAIVRASEAGPPTIQPDGITAWDMTTGDQLTIQGSQTPGMGLGENQGFLLTTGPLGNPSAAHFSDLVQATNNRAIAIGSQRSSVGQVDDTTFIDFLKIDPPPSETTPPTPPTVTRLNTFVITGTTSTTRAGHAHDVAITPNGGIVVVAHRNWVHILNSNGRLLLADNVGSEPKNFNGFTYSECTPDLAVDSVAVTDTRAVVVVTKSSPSTPLRIMVVYVYDLAASTPVRVSALHVDDIPHSTATLDVVAHDVAVTPDGTKAVVTGNGVTAFLALNTSTPILQGIVIDGAESRSYRLNADSVEVTNTRAVVTSSLLTTHPHWQIKVFDLTTFALIGGPYIDSDVGATSPKEAHDLVITPDGTQAMIRAGVNIVVIQNLAVPPSVAVGPVVITVAGDPHNAFNNTRSLTSDSILATNTVAIGIGTSGNGANSDGIVDFVDLSVQPAILAGEAVIVHQGQGNRVHSCDVKLTPDGTRVVVRSSDNSSPPATSAVDVRLYSCVLGGISNTDLARFEASGNLFGIDSLEVGTLSLISISESRNNNNGSGFVRVQSLN